MRRLFSEFFKNILYKAMFVLGVIYVAGTVVKMALAPGVFDVLILFFSLLLIGGTVYFQKRENVNEVRRNLKKAADDIKAERERAELLARKRKDAEIDKAADRYDDFESEAEAEKALKQAVFSAEDEFKAMFGFWSVKLKNVIGYFRWGNLYDKIMCAAIILAVFLVFEPYSLYTSEGIPFFLLEVAFVAFTIVGCGFEFWLIPGVPILIIKFVFAVAVYDNLIIITVTAVAVLVAAALVFMKWRFRENGEDAENSPPEPVKASVETPTPDKSATLQSRFGEEEYADSLMIYSKATFEENDTVSLDIDELIERADNEKE